MAGDGGGHVAEIVRAHLVHVGRTALQQDDGEVPRTDALARADGRLAHIRRPAVCGILRLNLFRLVLPRQRLTDRVAREVDDQHVGGRGLLHGPQLAG